MDSLKLLQSDIKALSNPEKAKNAAWFFKTEDGQYGAGDVFVGLTVPESRRVAKKYTDLSLTDLDTLLCSPIHEERLIALFILIHQYAKDKKQIVDFYLSHTTYINNWDLVDSSADKILGEYIYTTYYSSSPDQIGVEKRKRNSSQRSVSGRIVRTIKPDILSELAHSSNLWEKRIAMIATFAFIKKGKSHVPLHIAEILIRDKHDLIQKAVGWMLREVGKRCSRKTLEEFLKKHYKTMPRTALRYAIEHFPPETRKRYLRGEI